MALCVKALYDTFPEIKAFGCCHEVFGTQKLLARGLEEICGIENVDRKEIKVNVVGINHFTWLTKAEYKDINLFDVYKKLIHKHNNGGVEGTIHTTDKNWMNKSFTSCELVKMDLFERYGYIAAAGDRHLTEFCEGNWYLENPDKVKEMGFALTTVDWRIEDLNNRLERSKRLLSGEEEVKIEETGEEGVMQMRALLGLADLVTNVNIPNIGQIPNLPMDAVVETNAVFRANSLVPVMAGNIPDEIYPLVSRIAGEQMIVARACKDKNLELAMAAPEKFAAIAPICGSGIYWNTGILKDIPIMMYHGDCDDAVPINESINMLSSIHRKGGNAQLKICYGIGHNAWDYAYTDDFLIDWMLEKHL